MLRILTERKQIDLVETILRANDIDYTIYSTSGSWKNHPERSMVIEVFTNNFGEVQYVAELIGKLNGQQAVVIQHITDTLHVYSTAEDKWSSSESALTNMQGLCISSEKNRG